MKSREERQRIARAVTDFQAGRDREKSFRVLFDQYYDVVQSFFVHRVPAAEDRLDLTQETFLRVYKGLESYRREADFGTWVFRIAFNTHMKWLRRAKGDEVSLEAVTRGGEPAAGAGVGVRPTGDPPSPLDDALRRERQRRLREAIEKLPRQMYRCTLLRVYQDLSYREIAIALRLSIDTVKVHLFQARKKLRETLQDGVEELDLKELGKNERIRNA
jgi:RNA polymerase sigma-70 factor (ECF subfamily)